MSVRWSVGRSVGEHESKSGKNSVSAPAHPSATGIGRVSGLVLLVLVLFCLFSPISFLIFSRVLRDSTTRFVGPSVGPSVRPSVRHTFQRKKAVNVHLMYR